MQNSRQKKSLFSQRIKQARQKEQQNSQTSFPKAPKICTEVLVHQQQMFKKKKQSENKFIDRILKSELKDEQIKSIQNDNLRSISNMSKQEIKKYQQLIIKEMPSGFLQKLTKNNARIKLLKEQQMHYNSLIEEQGQDEEEQKMNEGNEEQEDVQYQQQTGEMGSLSALCFDIQKMRIKINHDQIPTEKQQIVSMSGLKLMISSQNNQTQIVGSKLLFELCKNLSQQSKNPEIAVVMIQGQWLHLTMLVEDIYKYFMTSLMKQIKKTNFKSCWIQMMINFLKCVNTIGWSVKKIDKGQIIKTVSQFLKTQVPRIQTFDLHNWKGESGQKQQFHNISNLSNTIQTLQSQLQSKESSCLELLNSIKHDPFAVIQQLRMQLIELCRKQTQYKFQTLLQRVSKKTQIEYQGRYGQIKEYLIDFVYGLSLQLLYFDYKTNRMNHEFDIVKQALYCWVCSLLNTKYLLPNLAYFQFFRDQTQQSQVFKCLMVTRILSYKSYTQLLALEAHGAQMINQVHIENEKLANLLTYLNIQEYFNSKTKIETTQQKQVETENINKMICFIDHRLTQKQDNYLKSIPEIVFTNLLAIFQSDIQSPSQSYKAQKIQLTYNDINQNILDSTVAHLCEIIIARKMEAKLWQIIPEQKLRSLISSYNYNSFGNYVFTKLLLFLVVCCPNSNTEVIVIEEVMSRYPFLFFYAAQEGLYGPLSMYIQGRHLQELKDIYDILTAVKPIDESNMFVRYLLKK